MTYVFSGFGSALGQYKVTNSDLEDSINNGVIEGFDSQRILESEEYIQFLEKNYGASPVDFFIRKVMGFETRYHTTPFPPHHDPSKYNSVDLAVIAIDKALKDANVHPNRVGAWIISTASLPEQAPGIASTVKSYLVNENNDSPVLPVHAGCPGFHHDIFGGVSYLEMHNLDYVVVAHSETMTTFLRNSRNFISLATFGDGAGAIVLAKKDNKHNDVLEGLHLGIGGQDPKMIGHLGVTNGRDLYIHPDMIRLKAVPNMSKSGKALMQKLRIKPEDIDLFIPHQTGDKIVMDTAKKLGIPENKVYTGVQRNYGNISGTSIPLAFDVLHREGKLKPGMKILTTSVGTGGEYGAFLYVVPQHSKNTDPSYSYDTSKDLEGRVSLLTGSTSSIGSRVAIELAKRGSELILHYNSNDEAMKKLEEELRKIGAPIVVYKADFNDRHQVQDFIEKIKNHPQYIDYLIHTAGIPGSVDKVSNIQSSEREKVMNINFHAPVNITTSLMNVMTDRSKIVYLGSIAEDHQFEGSAAYVSSKKALHGHAASFSGELFRNETESIYYMIGLANSGMVRTLNSKQTHAVTSLMDKNALLEADDVAKRIVNSLYKVKVLDTNDTYEGKLLVRRDGYRI
jgi:3-oxoacyl-[acyl-carrier-protein] synthase-3